MKILFTGRYGKDVVDSFLENWEKLSSKTEKINFGMRSIDPPSVLQILGELVDWMLPFKIAASAFLAQLAKEAAKDLWKNKSKILEILKRSEFSNIEKASKLFSDTIQETDNEFKLILSLEIPNKNIDANLIIKDSELSSISYSFSIFITKLELVQKAIEEEINSGNPPLQLVDIIILENGDIKIRWMDSNELKRHERIL